MKPECKVDTSGNKWWHKNYDYHREDGPAVEYTDGHKEWWVHDRRLFKEDFTSIEMVVQLKAFELFTPKELMRLKNDRN